MMTKILKIPVDFILESHTEVCALCKDMKGGDFPHTDKGFAILHFPARYIAICSDCWKKLKGAS